MRVLERLDELYAIGGGPGANRPHPGAGEDEAHELAAEWMRQAGLDVEVDPSGNLLGTPRSGRTCGSARISTPCLRAGASTGARGHRGPRGRRANRARYGRLFPRRGGRLRREPCAVRGSGPLPSAFVELHVEQVRCCERRRSARRRLEHRRLRPRRACVRRRGRACGDHADGRSAGRARGCGGGNPADQGRGTPDRGCGGDGRSISVEPAGSNVIPARAVISVDARAPDAEKLDDLVRTIGVVLGPAHTADGHGRSVTPSVAR